MSTNGAEWARLYPELAGVQGNDMRKLPDQPKGRQRQRHDLTDKFMGAWQLLADKSLPAPEREFRFCARMWRLDLAWPTCKLCCEFDGGTYTQGRHSRGKGQVNDADKANEAQAMGWLILRFTTDHLTNKRITQTVDTVQRVLRWRIQETLGTA